MTKSYASIHELIHDLYVVGGRLAPYANYVDSGARRMLERTTIWPSLWRANVLHEIVSSGTLPSAPVSGRDHSLFLDVNVLLSDCYEPIVDDLLILSVIEIHAKAQLLRRGYVIHDITAPAILKKRQKTSPIHVRSVRAVARRGDKVTFRENTLGINTLLEKDYRKIHRLPDSLLNAVAGVRQRRNLVHFSQGFGWMLHRELLELVRHLNVVVPPIKRRARRR